MFSTTQINNLTSNFLFARIKNWIISKIFYLNLSFSEVQCL